MDAGVGVIKSEGRQPDKQNNNRYHQHYSHRFFRQVSRVVLLLGVMWFVVCHSTDPIQVVPRYFSSYSPLPQQPTETKVSSSSLDSGEVQLQRVLKEAAMRDKTVIITTLNGAWVAPNSIFDVFLESFEIGNQTKRLLNHLVVIALDQKAYESCLGRHPHCYLISTNGKDFSGQAFFMSTDYLDMMWRRILFLHSVLKLGYNFVFTDADIMWFRDPFPHFYSDADFQIACDFFGGNPSDLNNNPNGGFNYVKSNNHTINFYKFWYTSRVTYPGLHDQDVLNKIKFDPISRKIGIKMKFLDTAYFGGFCQPSHDLNKVCTMHANCCIGLDRKIHDLKIMLEDWRKFLSLPDNVRTSEPPSWTVPQNCSLTSFVLPDSPKKVQQGNNN